MTEVMEYGSADLGPHSENLGITEKMNMKMGSNFDPRQKENFKCRSL